MMIDEVGRRFAEHQKIAMNILKLIPSFIDDTPLSDLPAMFNHYKDNLRTDDSSVHTSEFVT